MKPLVKKILEAGLVDKHTARMLERWGQLEDGAEDLVGQRRIASQKTLEEFVEDLEGLLETEGDVKETRLEIQVRRPPAELYNRRLGTFAAVQDEMGRYIVSPVNKLYRGDAISDDAGNMEVLEVEPLYHGEKLVAYQVTVHRE